MNIDILQGDCIETLQKLDDKSINTCITSPPYWGLRDYGESDQLGLEDTPEEFVENLVKVFREVKRVLRDDGTVWLNLGDSYSSGGRTTTTNQTLRGDKNYGVTRPKPSKGIKPKDLIGIPWRVALALQQDGWYLRQDIIWHKPNPMPESVKDRCTKAHEYIFLLSKNPKYYFDNESIKEDCVTKPTKKNPNKNHGKYKTQENESAHRQGIHGKRGDKLIKERTKLPKQKDLVKFLRSKTSAKLLANNTDIPLTKIEHWFRADEAGFAYPSIEDWKKIRDYIDDWSDDFFSIDKSLTHYELKTDAVIQKNKKNKRSVWTVSTKSFKGAHFATFPMDLIEPCVLAGCPEGGTVLDPFGGSGTTGIVAVNHNRNATLCELNKEYIEIAKKRIEDQVGMLANVEVQD